MCALMLSYNAYLYPPHICVFGPLKISIACRHRDLAVDLALSSDAASHTVSYGNYFLYKDRIP
jgi:hypothetical protein